MPQVFLLENECAMVIEALRSYRLELLWFVEQQMRDGIEDGANQDRNKLAIVEALLAVLQNRDMQRRSA